MEIISFNISKKLKRTKKSINPLLEYHSFTAWLRPTIRDDPFLRASCVRFLDSNFLVSLTANYYASHHDSTYAYLSPLCRSRRRFHVSSRRRSERSIRQFQQTRPSRRLQKVLHMFGRYRERVRMPYRHCVQDRWCRWQRCLRRSWGRSWMVSRISLSLSFIKDFLSLFISVISRISWLLAVKKKKNILKNLISKGECRIWVDRGSFATVCIT